MRLTEELESKRKKTSILDEKTFLLGKLRSEMTDKKSIITSIEKENKSMIETEKKIAELLNSKNEAKKIMEA